MKKLYAPILLALILLASAATLPAQAQEDLLPVAENLEITTYRGVSAGGRLRAVSPTGSALTYEITTPPVKGEIELGDDGSFVYTPREGKKGKDYFGYRALDCDGNASQEATFIIRIKKQKTKVCYSDLTGNGSAYAAVELAENGIFTGERLGDAYMFRPEQTVSRGEFLTLCMNTAGTKPLSDVVRTGFADDSQIALWIKPYVSTALRCGIISGYDSDNGYCVFAPERGITAAEAAVMLDRTLNLSNAVAVWSELDAAVPAWASQSAVNISASGVCPPTFDYTAPTLTRAQAADMLCAALASVSTR